MRDLLAAGADPAPGAAVPIPTTKRSRLLLLPSDLGKFGGGEGVANSGPHNNWFEKNVVHGTVQKLFPLVSVPQQFGAITQSSYFFGAVRKRSTRVGCVEANGGGGPRGRG